MTPNSRAVALAAAFAFLLPSAAFADRPPTDEERGAIEAMLEGEGFTEWGEIEFDGDDREVWSVDNAMGEDGVRYDLELDGELDILERDRDD